MMGGRRGQQWSWVEIAAVAALVLAAGALRMHRLDAGWFGVDQARDIATALDVAAGRELPTIGPTMRRVTRLGALYYYFWALPYLLWRDPIAGYWFAALLSTAAVVLTWALARRLWGPLAAVVTLAIAAMHPVWILDGRIAWAPAALPAAASVLLWLVATRRDGRAPISVARAAALGAALGLAVQLHLAMVPWAAAALVVLLLDRTPAGAWIALVACFVLVAAPAGWAVLARPASESGVAALAADQGGGGLGGRIVAIAALPIRVPAAFSRWPEFDPSGGALATCAGVVFATAVALGLLRLTFAARTAERATRLAAFAGLATILLVAMLPGAPWYYYLDALLPVWALGVGLLVADGTGERRAARVSPRARMARGPIAAVLVVAAVVVGARMAAWLTASARQGYVAVEPALLSLESRPGHDAALPGRLVSLRVKRALAKSIGTRWSRWPAAPGAEPRRASDDADFADLWRRLHGPAWDDATGDNAFWLRFAHHPRATTPERPRQFAVWYRDDPTAAALAALPGSDALQLTTIGPLMLADYASAIDYASCTGGGEPVTVPVRSVPQPKRYGDGTPEKPAALPAHVECGLRSTGGATRVVASLSGPGRVGIAAGDRRDEGPSAALCVRPPIEAFTLTTSVPSAGATALDVYDAPGAVACER